ncbi:MAG: hypothetical protein HY591_02580 [Candidatus Omnitrophica bacterium]|nr:hypothetical protein [Candidatus Omnitrophota bacterium]
MVLKAFLLFSLTFTAYSFMLSSPFKTMDDQYSIVGNSLIKDPSQWPRLFSQGYFRDRTYYRPLANLTFMAEYKFFGLDSFFYNLDNLFLHIINVFLVWALANCLMRTPPSPLFELKRGSVPPLFFKEGVRGSWEVGFWTALLFAIHPIQWEAVANISGRAILLSTMFSLISFVAYLKQRWVIALLSFAAALLCKESAAILPGVFFIHALIYHRDLRWVWAYGAVLAGYIFLRHHLGITEFYPWRNWHEHAMGILTFLRSIITHARSLALPTDLHFDRSLKLFTGAFEAGALMTIFIWSVVLAWLGIARKKMTGLQWFTIGWFFLSLLPVSQIVSTIGVAPGYISTAEHFLYLACVPVFIAAVQYVLSLRAAAVKMAALGFLGFCFLTTVEQNIYAQNELAMMERSLRIQPHNSRLHASAGLIYALAEKFPEAEVHFRAAVADDPFNARHTISLGKSICDQGRIQECLDIYNGIKDPGNFAELLKSNRALAQKLLKKDP